MTAFLNKNNQIKKSASHIVLYLQNRNIVDKLKIMEEEVNFKHSLPVQLRFSDVDQLGHVNNSVYFSLYDLAKTEYFNKVMGDKLNYSNDGVVVANVQANFFASVYFSEKIAIQTATVRIGHKSFTLLQRAINTETGEVKCVCQTVMVGYNIETKQSREIPEAWKQALADFEGNPDLLNPQN